MIAGAEVGVDQRRAGAQLLRGSGNRFARFAQEQSIVGRDALGMRRHLALEHIDVAAGKEIAQMIVGPSIAQSNFEDRPGQGVDGRLQEIQTIALRLHARDEAVEPTHSGAQATLFVVASCNFWLVSSRRWASSRMTSTAICGNSATRR